MLLKLTLLEGADHFLKLLNGEHIVEGDTLIIKLSEISYIEPKIYFAKDEDKYNLYSDIKLKEKDDVFSVKETSDEIWKIISEKESKGEAYD